MKTIELSEKEVEELKDLLGMFIDAVHLSTYIPPNSPYACYNGQYTSEWWDIVLSPDEYHFLKSMKEMISN